MHTILKPTARLRHKTEKSKFWKVTIENSIESFLLRVNSKLELEEKIRNKILTYSEFNITLQPLIIQLRNSSEKQFGVYFDSKYYLFNSLEHAIDLCFKTFFVFDLKYPIECQLVWKFFENFVYGMQSKESEQSSTLISFITNLKNLKKN